MKKCNILIAGVGGQGTLFASRVLGHYADIAGFDCKLSEVHGMAQRGGSVVTYVKIGDKVNSPIIDEGDADIILGFELLEAARWRHYLKSKGFMIVNRQKIMPLPVITGTAVYPEDLMEKLDKCDTTYIDALEVAKQTGSSMVGNTVMIGALAYKLGLDCHLMKQAVAASVKPSLYEVNAAAFAAGYKIGANAK